MPRIYTKDHDMCYCGCIVNKCYIPKDFVFIKPMVLPHELKTHPSAHT